MYSSSRVTAGCRADATTRLRPWNRRGGARVDSIEPGANLGRPCRFSARVDFAFETLNQLTCECGSLFLRKAKSFEQELFGVHAGTQSLDAVYCSNLVARGGIEPSTLRFSVVCSTN
jgi:hypothetical protein